MADKKKKPEQPAVKPVATEVKATETFECDLFTIVNHEGEFLIALGNHVVSKEKFGSREEAAHYIECKPWELILNSTAVMWEKLNNLKEQLNK